jgi:hypothetical protein
MGCDREDTSLAPYPPPQATGANPLLKQLAKLPQATSPLIMPSAKRHRRLFVQVMCMVVALPTHRRCLVSQDNKKSISFTWGAQKAETMPSADWGAGNAGRRPH